MKPLTEKQQEVLNFVKSFFREWQRTPSRREIAEHFRFNNNAADSHIGALERKNVIQLMQATEKSKNHIMIPSAKITFEDE